MVPRLRQQPGRWCDVAEMWISVSGRRQHLASRKCSLKGKIADAITITGAVSIIAIVSVLVLVLEKTKAQRGAVTCSRSPRVLMERWA